MKVSTQVAALLVTITRLRAVLPFLLLAFGCRGTEPDEGRLGTWEASRPHSETRDWYYTFALDPPASWRYVTPWDDSTATFTASATVVETADSILVTGHPARLPFEPLKDGYSWTRLRFEGVLTEALYGRVIPGIALRWQEPAPQDTAWQENTKTEPLRFRRVR